MSRPEPNWHQYRITKRTQEYVYLGHATTDSSIDDFDRSTPSLHSDNDRSETSDTNRTRSCDSDNAPTRTVADLKQDLKEQQETIAPLQAEREQATVKVQEDATRYKELEEKYAKQILLLKDDKKKVDKAWEYCEEAAQDCADLRAQVRTLEEQSRSTDEQHEAELQAKDEEIEQSKEDCQCAIAALEDTHEMEMEAIANEYEQTKLASRKAVDYLRKVVGTTEGNRKAWKAEKEQMESKIELISADARDTVQRNEDEIERLTRAKSLLEQQIDLFIGARQGQPADAGLIQQITEAILDKQKELAKSRRQNAILAEKVERVLEWMQQERDHWGTQYVKEKEAQAQVGELLPQMEELQDKLTRRDELLRAISEEKTKETDVPKAPAHNNKPSFGALT
jgi:hypothetical protein